MLEALDPKLRRQIVLDYNEHKVACARLENVSPTPFAVYLREMLQEGVLSDKDEEVFKVGPRMQSALSWITPDF